MHLISPKAVTTSFSSFTMNRRVHFSQPDDREAGFALVAVLGFFLLASLILLAFAESTRLRAVTAANEFQSFRYGLLAKAMVQLIADRVVENVLSVDLNDPDKWYQCRAGTHTILSRVTDHSGLIDLNSAPAELISQGLVALGLSREKAERVSKGMVRYRSFNPGTVLPEDGTVGVSALYKNAPFEDVIETKEFLDLKLVDTEWLYRIFTVDSKRGDVVFYRAPSGLRVTIGDGGTVRVPPLSPRPISGALTVDLQIFRHSRLEYSGEVVFSLTSTDARMKYLPQDINFAHQAGLKATGSECETLFGSTATEILRDVLE